MSSGTLFRHSPIKANPQPLQVWFRFRKNWLHASMKVCRYASMQVSSLTKVAQFGMLFENATWKIKVKLSFVALIHSMFAICYLLSVTCHLWLSICDLLSETLNLILAITCKNLFLVRLVIFTIFIQGELWWLIKSLSFILRLQNKLWAWRVPFSNVVLTFQILLPKKSRNSMYFPNLMLRFWKYENKLRLSCAILRKA